MSHSKWLSQLLAAALIVLASASGHAAASYSETIRLVRSMREDELLIAALRAKADEELKAGTANSRGACLANLKYPFITDAIALVISSQLTDDEVAEGIAFYRSSAGHKHVEQILRELLENQPASTASFTAEEQAAFRKFTRRSVGSKLLKDKIAQQPAVIDKVNARLRIAVDDCLYAASTPDENSALIRPKTCATKPLVSPDNACSVEQNFNVYPPPSAHSTTSIVVSCATGGETLVVYQGHVKGLGVKWLGARTVEVAAPRGLPRAWDADPRRFRMQLKETLSDGPSQQCWPELSVNDSNRVAMDSSQAQPFWMSYADKERCILGKRNDAPSPSRGSRPWVMQFRQVKATELPYATTQLVFFETFSSLVHTRSIRIQGTGAQTLELQPGGPRAGFHLVGAPAESLLKQLAAGSALTMEVQPAEGDAFSIPLAKTDLDWARPGFDACVRAL